MTDTTRLPGGGEDRVVKCPVCSNTMTKMEAEGVAVSARAHVHHEGSGFHTKPGRLVVRTAPPRHSVASDNDSKGRGFPLNQGNEGWGISEPFVSSRFEILLYPEQ